MAKATVLVDLFNPGQVFACMGFLEAADLLLGNAVGGFERSNEGRDQFSIETDGTGNPIDVVVEFITKGSLQRVVPSNYVSPQPPSSKNKAHHNAQASGKSNNVGELRSDTFPAKEADEMTLPLRLEHDKRHISITHWCDGSTRNSFKLFAGQQRGYVIAGQMLEAIRKLWSEHRYRILEDPFGPAAPLGGSSFKFDPRKSWTGIDAGYSPDEQSHDVQASPIVELLAAIGLEHARPDEYELRKVRYGVWGIRLPPLLARPALSGASIGVPMRVFRFTLELAGKNKIMTFAEEETL